MSKLGKIMKANGISQVQLARSMGVTKGTVNIMVKNGIKNIDTAKKYASYLGVEWPEIVD